MAVAVSVLPNQRPQLLQGEGLLVLPLHVDRSVAVRTERHEVLLRADSRVLACLADGIEVVHLDHPIGIRSILETEVEIARLAPTPVDPDALRSSASVAFVIGGEDLLAQSFNEVPLGELRDRGQIVQFRHQDPTLAKQLPNTFGDLW